VRWPEEARLELRITLAALFVAALLAALFGWLGARKPDPFRHPRLVPYRFLMLLAAAVVMVALVHLVDMARHHGGG
jgi:hypothetical protein